MALLPNQYVVNIRNGKFNTNLNSSVVLFPNYNTVLLEIGIAARPHVYENEVQFCKLGDNCASINKISF